MNETARTEEKMVEGFRSRAAVAIVESMMDEPKAEMVGLVSEPTFYNAESFVGVNVTKDTLLAGRSTFTVSNSRDEHRTYKVSRKDPEKGSKWERFGPTYFVALLSGPNNETDYTYLGMLCTDPAGRLYLKLTKASRMNTESPAVKIFSWALLVIEGVREIPAGYGIAHDGSCARCGRKLTDPISIGTGLGPICGNRESELEEVGA